MCLFTGHIYYSNIYRKADIFRRASGDNVLFRHAAILYGGYWDHFMHMACVLAQRDSISVAIPVLGVLAAAQKLLPSLHRYIRLILIKGARAVTM